MFEVRLKKDMVLDIRGLHRDIERAMKDAAGKAESRIVASLDQEVSPGKIYHLRNPYTNQIEQHQASQPGDPPNTFTGDLSGGVRTGAHQSAGGTHPIFEMYATAEAGYAELLEYGGVSAKGFDVAPRPYLQPGLDYGMEFLERDLEGIVQDAIDMEDAIEWSSVDNRGAPPGGGGAAPPSGGGVFGGGAPPDTGGQGRARGKKEQGKARISANPIKELLETRRTRAKARGVDLSRERSAKRRGLDIYHIQNSKFVHLAEIPPEGVHARKLPDTSGFTIAKNPGPRPGSRRHAEFTANPPKAQTGKWGFKFNSQTGEISRYYPSGNIRRMLNLP